MSEEVLGIGKGARVHFVGIGGAGLSAIARVLLERGYEVSGSDIKPSPLALELARLGATIYEGHRAEHVTGARMVVVSSAVPPHNPEVVEARRRGIPVVKRDFLLGRMMEGHLGIAVAGTHGKTTTTSMLAFVLEEAGLDPTFIVGGVLDNLGTNARAGRGPYFVVEADEYDHTFLGLHPRIAVVTAIELDHPDCYPTLEAMREAFRRFLALVPRGGYVVGCLDEEGVRAVLGDVKEGVEVVTYGLGEGAQWRGTEVRVNGKGGNDFSVLHRGKAVGRFSLRIPGVHNVRNALAAVAVAGILGLDMEGVAGSLARFRGARRRFEVKGEAAGVLVIDDYAHHPTEIKATLAAVRERYPGRTVWAVFQPHTYSRTKALLAEFAASFADADHVIITDIFAAREHDDLGVSAADIVKLMSHPDARHIPTLEEAAAYLLPRLKPGDVLITLGAGDGYRVGERVLSELRE